MAFKCESKNKSYHKNYNRVWRSEHPEKQAAKQQEYRRKNPDRLLFDCAKRRARLQGLPFNLEVGDIVIPKTCPALGIVLKPGKGHAVDSSPTVDRKQAELGYVKGNVVVVSSLANRIKTSATIEQVEKVLEWMKAL